MSHNSFCRICLAIDVRMFSLVPLQVEFEKVTGSSLYMDKRPMVACYICFSQLQKSHQLIQTSAMAEMMLTEIFNNHHELPIDIVAQLDRPPLVNLSIQPVTKVDITATLVEEMQIKCEPSGEEDKAPNEMVDCESADEKPAIDLIDVGEEEIIRIDPSDSQMSDGYNSIQPVSGVSVGLEQQGVDDTFVDLVTPSGRKSAKRNTGDPTKKPCNSKAKPKKVHVCKVCNKEFRMQHLLTYHERVHSTERPFVCDICGGRFKTKQNLKEHLSLHETDNRQQCNICGKRVSGIKAHLGTHSSEKKYECDICHRKFTFKAQIYMHIKSKHQTKPHKCHICGASFVVKSHLGRHLKRHDPFVERPYKCSVCEKGFWNNSQLQIHYRVHTGEKPFKCNICSKSYKQNSTLTSHMRKHTGEKPFECEICHKRFYQGGHLHMHRKKHDNVKRKVRNKKK